MGGEREYKAPAKSTEPKTQGEVIGQLRIHENAGEIHFHDDAKSLKTAVPVATMYDAWEKLADGRKKKFNHIDETNGTELRIKVIGNKKQPTDLHMEIRPLVGKKRKMAGLTTKDFQQFDKFIKG